MNLNKVINYGYVCINVFNRCIAKSRNIHLRTWSAKFQENYRKTFPGLIPIYAALAFMGRSKTDKKTEEERKINKIINDADRLFENGHYKQCYEYLNSLEESNVEIQWRISRALYNMSKDTKIDNKYRKMLITEAFDIIQQELKEHHNNFAVHKWYALLLDAKSADSGIKERIKQLENVKKHMDLAVTLNPGDATTLHMLGEWCYQIAEMPWHQRKIAETLFASPPHSSYEDALEYFSRAESVQPRFYSVNLLRLGACYLKLKKEDQAKYYLTLAAAYPAKSNDDHMANKEAAELLKKVKM